MSVIEIRQQITALPRAEQVKLAMLLWESLDESEIESPAWHAEVLAERQAEIASGDAQFLTTEQLKKRLHR